MYCPGPSCKAHTRPPPACAFRHRCPDPTCLAPPTHALALQPAARPLSSEPWRQRRSRCSSRWLLGTPWVPCGGLTPPLTSCASLPAPQSGSRLPHAHSQSAVWAVAAAGGGAAGLLPGALPFNCAARLRYSGPVWRGAAARYALRRKPRGPLRWGGGSPAASARRRAGDGTPLTPPTHPTGRAAEEALGAVEQEAAALAQECCVCGCSGRALTGSGSDEDGDDSAELGFTVLTDISFAVKSITLKKAGVGRAPCTHSSTQRSVPSSVAAANPD